MKDTGTLNTLFPIEFAPLVPATSTSLPLKVG